ncbi:aromatic alcohol reductase [Mycolicibacterium smegmatis]|uniref:Isoflavone reductase n=3 Tax=Mycolicibacterium smegmatis TaxID=1772 RepID=I7GGN7_MYCS2|nr:aromatic alcohol reductase [Mycolicibacterium smegmatis]ABK72854.1 isoflavone reductase [Mycolicibacterium smegmatis MC2 155]AFP42999.1 Isoflavone reductase [Mycolicibacterium smegmatis MC2 155]AIU11720.1 2'-hydroxyisoflavone reductase [Mycolicibacterium smegmatis MC2 155]AIU18345.1 2'-hydroxyisoflavone reductase [Mycolicibacterium smegmatis]AIU24967.1 2'-hydroxyisoflavone reductase [Mycolicibacterium smegmatis]
MGFDQHENFLIIGAGELGAAVIDALSARIRDTGRHDTVTVLLRRSAAGNRGRQVAQFATKNVAVEYADVTSASVAELATIFSRYDTVVSCIGFAAGPGTQRKLARAAIEAGVARFLPWQFGVDYDLIGRGSPQNLFDEQLDVRDLLRGQDKTHWIIVSTGMFTSFLFEPAFGVVDLQSNTVHALGDWGTEVTLTTPEDIGRLTTEILYAEPRIQDQVVHVAGDTISYGQLADIVDDVLHTEVQRIPWSTEHLHTELADDPDDTMKKYRAVFSQGVGVAWPVSRTFNAARGIKTTTAREWAEANLTRP